MTSTISKTIEEIKKRFGDLKLSLENEKQLNVSLQGQIQNLTLENEQKAEQISLMEANLKQLETSLANIELEKQQQINQSTINKDLEIDFLVNEIDQCINQLKSNL